MPSDAAVAGASPDVIVGSGIDDAEIVQHRRQDVAIRREVRDGLIAGSSRDAGDGVAQDYFEVELAGDTDC